MSGNRSATCKAAENDCLEEVIYQTVRPIAPEDEDACVQ